MPFDSTKNKFATNADIVALTDNSAGVASNTLAAGITDAVAKNAVASLAAKVNAIITALDVAGITIT